MVDDMNNIVNRTTLIHLFKALCFFAFPAFLTLILSYTFQHKDGIRQYNTLAVKLKSDDVNAEPDNSLQIIFYGDSECYGAFSPNILLSEFDISSYNCATSAQKLCDTYAIMYENFKTQTPKIVVLETNCIFRNTEDVGFDNDPIMKLMYNNIPAFTYHSDWKIYIRALMPHTHDTKRRENKGYMRRDTVIPYKGGEYMKASTKKEKISDENLDYLEQIKSICKENNTIFLLVSTPSSKNWNTPKHNAVLEWANDNNVDYVDLNLEKDINIDWSTDTKDGGDHLNHEGAKKTTKFIGEYLTEHYQLSK